MVLNKLDMEFLLRFGIIFLEPFLKIKNMIDL